MATPLLREGETCWRAVPAARVAFLVDGEEFFGAVADALENARHSVWLLGWDFHSAVRLRRGSDADAPSDLVGLLEARVKQHSALHVHVLAWDFAMLYALEREFLPLLQFGAKTHRRIHFAMDSTHPVSASQHQKLVVVDGGIAFAGGFDLTTHRWDTREHRANDPRRRTPAGSPYSPFHDVQVAVDGEAASALERLALDRWHRATGRRVAPTRADRDVWPDSVEPHVRDVTVGISRTFPSSGGQAEIHEVEALYRESIASARRWIYIENQYLTSPRIGRWLAERLADPDGPEVVIVGPRENAGWLEESTMGALRDRVVRELRGSDRHDRLRVLYPHIEDLPPDQLLNVHSKVMVVDDDFARVGSSNLSNRSLGLDTECDVSFEGDGRPDVRRAIARLRDDLLAEHLGVTPTDVAAELEKTGSLVRTVDALCGGARTLRPLEVEASDWAADAVDAIGAVDPEHPIPLEELVERFDGERGPERRGWWRSAAGFAATLVLIAAFTLAFQLTPAGEWLGVERVAGWLGFFRESWLGTVAATAVFALACLLFVPAMAMTAAAGLALGPVTGVWVAWVGTTAAAAIGHVVGRRLWRESVRRLAGDRLNALSRQLARSGILSSAVVRVIPLAPFMVVNLVAGASHVRARDFLIGTALGTLPGTVLLVVSADRTRALFEDASGAGGASGTDWLWTALAALALAGVVVAIRRLPRPDPSRRG